jgi:hypothetical protein
MHDTARVPIAIEVTVRTGHMGYTFRFFAEGVDAVEREFGYGTNACVSSPAWSPTSAPAREVWCPIPPALAARHTMMGYTSGRLSSPPVITWPARDGSCPRRLRANLSSALKELVQVTSATRWAVATTRPILPSTPIRRPIRRPSSLRPWSEVAALARRVGGGARDYCSCTSWPCGAAWLRSAI